MRRFASSAALFAAAAIAAPAQMVVSAHSGTLHYFEGNVSIDGVRVASQPGHFDELKEQSVLMTTRGRAEVLLTPGVFLRVGENSQLRMLDNRLASTRLELVSGSATLESDAEPTANGKYRNPAVTLIFKSYEVEPQKDGLLEITADPAQVRVFKGEARVQAGDNRVTVKDGHEVFLTAALATDKFDDKTAADDNYMWARDRSAVVSAANLSSARMLANNSGGSYMGGGMGGGLWAPSWGSSMYGGGWFFNPYFGMYTYMPMNGYAFSPFGYGFYSPGVINSLYVPGNGYWYGGGGARTASVIGRPVAGLGRTIGRPVSGAGNVTRGLGVNSLSMRPVSSSANVISSRAASAAMVNRSGGFSRPGGGEISGAGVAAGGGGSVARSSGGAMAGGAARSAGGGGARGR